MSADLFPFSSQLQNTKKTDPALHYAVIQNDIEQIKVCLSQSYDINAIDAFGYSPLDLAIYFEKPAVALLLLQHGTLIDSGARPLYLALSLNNTLVAQAIISHPDFVGDEMALRAFKLKQLHILDFLKQQQIETPLIDTLLTIKMLAHRFHLRGMLNIHSDDNVIPLNLEGHIREMAALETQRSFKNYAELLVLNPFATICTQTLDALTFAVQNNLNGKKLMERYYQITLSGEAQPILIPTGWHGHGIGLVIYGNTLYKCNAGQGGDSKHGIIAYHIGAPHALNETLFDKILEAAGSSYFLQKELDKLLQLTEIQRIETQSQVVGNCAWFNIIESVHAILFAQLSQEYTFDQAISLANTLYNNWIEHDLTSSLQHFPYLQDFPHLQGALDEVLSQILLEQHNALNPHHVQRGLYIISQVAHPIELIEKIDDPLFLKVLNDEIAKYSWIYQQSNWQDQWQHWLHDYLNNSTTTHTQYTNYQEILNLGKSLSALAEKYPQVFSLPTPTLTLEEIFTTDEALPPPPLAMPMSAPEATPLVPLEVDSLHPWI